MSDPTKLVCIPAYGRRFNSHDEAHIAWKEGRDFKIVDGPYFSCRDIDRLVNGGYVNVAIVHTLGGRVAATNIDLLQWQRIRHNT
jgi:hypothetical protein